MNTLIFTLLYTEKNCEAHENTMPQTWLENNIHNLWIQTLYGRGYLSLLSYMASEKYLSLIVRLLG